MKIECPNCHLTGQTSDINIPPEGRYMDCPRCKTNFFIQKKAVTDWANTMTDCPQCGYSSYSAERFDICPQCGLDAKAYNQQRKQKPSERRAAPPPNAQPTVDREAMRRELEQLERKEEEKRQRRAESVAAPVLPGHMDEPVAAETVAPQPVRYLGWAFVAAALALFVGSLKGYFDYLGLKPSQVAARYAEPPGSLTIFVDYGLRPLLGVILGICTLLAANQFLKMRRNGRQLLEIAAWCGVVFVIGTEAAGMYGWVKRSSSSPSLMYYVVGLADSMLMTALWSAPLLAAIWYLRSRTIRDEFPD